MTCHLWFPYFLLLLEASIASANVEKIIFRGPEPIEVPSQHPTLSDLKLQLLSPDSPVLRTSLHTQFASNDLPNGVASWYLLENLTKGQLYEVRICWAATQPSSFLLTTHEIPDVFANSVLISSLSNYFYSQQSSSTSIRHTEVSSGVQSLLLLCIFTAADYYTLNKTLMLHPEPVLVDIILDPFLFNVFPKSLVPTAGYILVVAFVAWWISKFASTWLSRIAQSEDVVKPESRKDK